MTLNRGAFFDACRQGVMGPSLDQGEVSGAGSILDAMLGAPLAYTAYALATAWHETAHTMQPVKEYGGPRYFHRMYDPEGARPKLAKANGNIQPGDGVKYCGRGYVQLTWRSNYRRAGGKLGIDLEGHPDLALRPEVAAGILRRGMEEGWFTGKAFEHFLPHSGVGSRDKFIQSRRIINGLDCAALIATYALQFQDALLAGAWS